MKNIYTTFDKIVNRTEKELILGQSSKVILFTGLSGSGKTTLASKLEQKLIKNGFFTQILDGDNIRDGINSNLTFSIDDRYENIRRVSEISKLFLNCGIITLCTFISPTEDIRQIIKDVIPSEDLYIIYVNTPLSVCEDRDDKGLYKKARSGIIPNFTGISSPFDYPIGCDLEIDTSKIDLSENVDVIYEKILPLITLK